VAGGGQPAQQVPEVLGAVAAQPAPASDPAPAADPTPAMAPAGTLPRTGTAVARETGLGMVLLAAGLAFVGFSRRRRQSPQR
jgi:LPXTG-motif cell wall-anchored protein